MASRAETLAKQFEVKVQEATKVIESVSDADWQKVTTAEKWSVGVVAHHIAMGHAGLARTIKAVADHGELCGDTVHGTYDASRQVFTGLENLGISYDDVVQVLEDEGVAKFEASWNELLDTIRTSMEH